MAGTMCNMRQLHRKIVASESGRVPAGMAVILASLLGLFTLLATQVASDAASAPKQSAAESSSLRSPAVDGFKRTVEYWNELDTMAREVQATVVTIANQTAETFPASNPKYLPLFNAKLAEKYPGAKYDGKTGSVPLSNRLVALFSQDFKVTKIMELLPIVGRRASKIYYIQERKFECNSDTNSITGLINRDKPSDSVFSEVKFPEFQDAVDKIFSVGPETRTANTSAGAAALNDAYQLSASTQGVRMDSFAEKFLLTGEMYNFVLKNAQTGYRQRHALEFSTTGSPKTASKVALPGVSATEGTFWSVGSFFIGLFFLVVALLAVLFYGFRWFYHQVRDNLNVENRVKASMKSRHQNKKKVTTKSDSAISMEHELCKENIRQAYRAEGYQLEEYSGPYSNLVDLILCKDNGKYYLNYKLWSNERIEADVLSNLYSAMSSESATGGIMISPAYFSRDARKVAREKRIEIVSDNKLLVLLQRGSEPHKSAPQIHGVDAIPLVMEGRSLPTIVGDGSAVQKSGRGVDGTDSVLLASTVSVEEGRDAAIDRYAEYAVADAVEKALAQVAWGQVTDLLGDSVTLAVEKQVAEAIERAVAVGVEQPVLESVARVVAATIKSEMPQTVAQSVAVAIEHSVAAGVAQPVSEAVARVVAATVESEVPQAVAWQVGEAITKAIATGVEQPVAEAVARAVAGSIERMVAQSVAVAIEAAVAAGVKQPVTDAVTRAVGLSVENMVPQAVAQPVSVAIEKAVAAGVEQPVNDAIAQAIAKGVERPVAEAVSRAVATSIENTVAHSVAQPVAEAIEKAVTEGVEQPVTEAVSRAVATSIENTVTHSVAQPVAEAIEKAVAEGVEQPVAEAIARAVESGIEQPVTEAIAQAIAAGVEQPVAEAVSRAVATSIENTVTHSVAQPVAEAIEKAVAEGVEQPVAEAVFRAVATSIENTVTHSVAQPVADAIEKAVAEGVAQPVAEAIEKAVAAGVEQPVAEAVSRAVVISIENTVAHSVAQPVAEAIEKAVAEGVEQPVAEAVSRAVATSIENTVTHSVAQPVADAIEKAVAEGVEQPVAKAVSRAVATVIEKTVQHAVAQPVSRAIEKAVAAGVGQPVTEAVAASGGRSEHADHTGPVRIEHSMVLDCTLCGKKMRVGTATKGVNAGKKFWVCSDYPFCKNIAPISG